MQPCGSERPNWELEVKLFPILVGKTEKCIISCKTVERSAGSNIYYAPITFGGSFHFHSTEGAGVQRSCIRHLRSHH